MKTFRPGEVARAEDVNANFSEIKRTADATAAAVKTTEWVNLTLGSGWVATGGHTPRARFFRGFIQIEGAVTRKAGGHLHQLARLPEDMRPPKAFYICSTLAVKNSRPNSPCEIYVGSDGWLSINYMNNLDSGIDWNVPISGITAF